jgi:hypothetical protein
MLCAGYTKVWELAPNELVKLDGARGTTLRVTRGRLWLTLEHDTRDVVLTAGDSFTIDRGGLTLIEAQGPATVCVLARHVDEVHLHVPRPTLTERFNRWLDSNDEAADRRGAAPYY